MSTRTGRFPSKYSSYSAGSGNFTIRAILSRPKAFSLVKVEILIIELIYVLKSHYQSWKCPQTYLVQEKRTAACREPSPTARAVWRTLRLIGKEYSILLVRSALSREQLGIEAYEKLSCLPPFSPPFSFLPARTIS